MHKYLIFCFILLTSGIVPPVSAAQNSNIQGKYVPTDSTFIAWVKQYPGNEKTNKKGNLLKKISNLITGEDEMQALIKPMSVVAFSPDSFLVADQGAACIFEISGNSFGIPGNLKKKFTGMSSLVGMCIGPQNDILFTDSRLGSIYKISSNRKSLEKLNDSLVIKQPTGIAWSKVNNEIWVVETAEHRILVLDTNGKPKKTIGIRGTGAGEFNFPTFIWIDESGMAFVVDAMNFRIQIFNSKGEFINNFGQAGDGSGYLARPKGIATDTFGNIYVADALFHNVQIFNLNGDFLYQFGGQGQGMEEFWMPSGIFIDRNNNIYVADSYNSRIQVFKLVKKQ
jgi:sugar lactone lactonase YvrE